MKLLQKAGRLITAGVLLVQMSGISTLLSTTTAKAVSSPTPTCTTNDAQGADDEPGQKDLTKMCSEGSSLPTSINVEWQWDEINWSGNNTGDACALFDKNNDGDADYAFCVVIGDNPAIQLTGSPVVYSCGNDEEDRCTNKILVDKTYSSSCKVSTGTDPFSGDANYPSDTLASCTIQLSDFSKTTAPTSAKLLDVCSYPSQQPNSDPSDCIIADTSDTTTVELRKDIAPDTDTGKFNLFINGDQLVTNGGDNSSTGQVLIKDDVNLLIKESQGASTLMSNYTATVACIDQQGKSVATATISSTSTDNSTTISKNAISKGDNLVCTFTNTRKTGKVKVVKDVVNNNGGTKKATDFTFTNNLGTAQTFTLAQNNEDGDRTLDLPLGSSFSIKEVQENSNGYTTSYSGCSGTVTESLQTCTITNDDQVGSLTIKKVVVNNNGGNNTASSFSFKKSGDTTVYSFENSISDTSLGSKTLTVNAGTYTVTETPADGYTQIGNTCVNVVVANGGTAECTITNDDLAPTVTIVKHVINDDGGTLGANNFGITFGGQAVVFGSGTADSSTKTTYSKTITVEANKSYTVSESDTEGYDEYAWSCKSGDTPYKGTSFSLSEGQSMTCEVTNDDQPAFLIVIKDILGNNGGTAHPSDFALYYGDTQIEHNTKTQVKPGIYEISEQMTEEQEKGYRYVSTVCGPSDSEEHDDEEMSRETWSTDVISAQVALGQTITCTVTNEEIAPKLTLKKIVEGGTSKSSDWTLSATPEENKIGAVKVSGNGYDGVSGVEVKAHVAYVLSEWSDVSGYSAGEWDCNGGWMLKNSITLDLGDDVTCTITNTEVKPTVTIIKNVEKNYGGTAVASDFSFTISDGESKDVHEDIKSGDTVTVSSYTDYKISEDQLPGYEFVSITGKGCPESLSDSFSLSSGDSITCTITNRDVAPRVHVMKFINGEVCNTYNFTATFEQGVEEDEEPVTYPFSLAGSENCDSDTRQSEDFDAYVGPVTISEETSNDWLTRAFCMANDSVVANTEGFGSEVAFDAELDTDYYCYFFNTEKASVKITKYEDKNKNGQMDEGEPTLSGWDLQAVLTPLGEGEITPIIKSGTTGEDGSVTFDVLDEFTDFSNFPQLTLEATETQKEGWVLSNITCTIRDPFTLIQDEKVVSDELLPTLVQDEEQVDTTIQPGSTAECFVGNTKKPITEVLSDTITPTVLSDTGASTTPLLIATTVLFISLALGIRRREEN